MAHAVGGGERGQGRRTGKMDTCHLLINQRCGGVCTRAQLDAQNESRSAIQRCCRYANIIILKTGAGRAARAAAEESAAILMMPKTCPNFENSLENPAASGSATGKIAPREKKTKKQNSTQKWALPHLTPTKPARLERVRFPHTHLLELH